MIPLFNFASQYANEIENPERFDVRIGHHVWDKLNDSFKAIMEGIGSKYLPEMKSGDTTTQVEAKTAETKKSLAKDALEKLKRNSVIDWLRKHFLRALFVISVIGIVGLLIYVSSLIPLSDDFTKAIRGSFVCSNLAAVIALVTAYLGAKNRWVALALTLAIDVFVGGMLFQLLSYL